MPHFNKEQFAQLLKIAKGQRSINQYALHSSISSAHISRLLRGLINSPPTVATILKLAEKAHNQITFLDLMMAAGHLAPLTYKEDSLGETPGPYCCQQESCCLSLPVYRCAQGCLSRSGSKFLSLPTYVAQEASFIVELADDTFEEYSLQKGDWLLVRDMQSPSPQSCYPSEELVELVLSQGVLGLYRKDTNSPPTLIGTITTAIKYFTPGKTNT